MLLFVFAAASSRADESPKDFDVPSDVAAKSLKVFAQQSGVEVLVSADLGQSTITQAVKGEMTAAAAIQGMLQGTGLVAQFDQKNGVYAIKKGSEADPNAPGAVAPTADRPSSSAQTDDEDKKAVLLGEFVVKDRKPFLGSNIDLPRTKDDIQPYYIWGSTQIANSGAVDIQDFFQRMVPMDTNRESITQTPGGMSAASNISLGGLSGNSSFTSGTQNTLILVDGLPLPNITYRTITAEPDLNGIPLAAVDHIEVLPVSASAIYGASVAAGMVNIVLKHDYSGVELSSTYSSPVDGHAPTENVSLTAGGNFEGGKTNLLFTASYQTEQPLVLQNRLSQIVSPYQARYFGLYPGGESGFLGIGTATPLAFSAEPIVTSANGTPLFAGTAVTQVQVPAGYQGGQGSALLQANAGNFNLSHPDTGGPTGIGGLRYPMTQGTTEKSFGLLLRREMAPWLEIYGQFRDSSNDTSSFLDNFSFTGITEPATAPGNPFGQAVKISGVEPSNLLPTRTEIVTRNASMGAKINLPLEWKADLDYSWGSSNYRFFEQITDSTALQAAVTNGSTNLITDLGRYPINAAAYSEFLIIPENSSVDALQLKLAGPLMKLWAGAPSLAFGVEHQKNGNEGSQESVIFPGRLAVTGVSASAIATEPIYFASASQSDDSGYAELTMPLVSKANGIPGVSQLDLQAAGRYDSVHEVATSPLDVITENLVGGAVVTSPDLTGTTTVEPFANNLTHFNSSNGTIGIKYQPVDDIFFRASYSSGFVPPTYSDLQSTLSAGTQTQTSGFFPGVPTTSPHPYTQISDPLLNATYSVPFIVGGNPNLKPETSRGVDWGVVFEPTFLKGLRVSLDYTRITKSDDIIAPLPQTLIADAAQFPGRVVRGTPNSGQSVGPIVLLDESDINAPETLTSYFNVEADYTLITGSAGTWKVAADAFSWQHYEIQSVIGGASVEQLGNPDVSPLSGGLGSGAALAKFKGTLGLDWAKGPFSAGWLVRYVGPYNEGSFFGAGAPDAYEVGTVNGWVSGQVYHDVYLGYKFRNGALSGVSVQAGVKNIFSHIPPFDGTLNGVGAPYWFSAYGDPQLATYQLTIRKKF